jgi:hypothetical protein
MVSSQLSASADDPGFPCDGCVGLQGAISVIGRAAIVHALEDNCVREEGPGGDLSAGARIGFCVIGFAQQEESAEITSRRAHIREQYHGLLAQYNRTRAP